MLKDFEIKGAFSLLLYKTNRFHVAVRLLSNKSQMTSKYGKNKKVAHPAFYYSTDARQHGIYFLMPIKQVIISLS